ncbi:PH domain-containing protein [bacterium]|nr:PH domain-containing protein [bacterium]
MIYSLNTVIITNKRIIENQQLGLFKHVIKEIELKNIQDISIEILGVFAQFLNYGNIEIQSAGAIAKFNFTRLPNPQKIKNIIVKARQAIL